MSLILEALRKSEAERRLGETPTLLSPVGSAMTHALRQAERRQRLWMLAALALLVVLAIAGTVWTLRAPPAALDRAVPHASASRASAPVEGMAKIAPTTGDEPSAANVASDTTHERTVDAAKLAAVSDASVAAISSPPSRPIPPSANTALASDPQVVVAAPAAPATPAQSEPDAAMPIGTASLPIWLRVDQLPAAERSALPPLKVSMHVYAEDPAKRAVLIDGQRYHEGQWIAEGVQLKAIRRDGSLLAVNGRELLLGRP